MKTFTLPRRGLTPGFLGALCITLNLLLCQAGWAQQKRVTEPLVRRFPRTRSLLSELERSDPAVYEAVLRAGRKALEKERAKALHFAKIHHPALAKILFELKRKSPKAYAAGVDQLTAEMRRLNRSGPLSPQERKRAIAAWRRGSELRLRAARLVRKEEEGQFRRALLEQLRREEASRRRELKARILRLKQQLAKLEHRLGTDPEVIVQRKLARWERDLKRRRNSRAKKHRRKGDQDR